MARLERKPGQRTDITSGSDAGGSEYAATLDASSLDQRAATRLQVAAKLPEEKFERHFKKIEDLVDLCS